MIGNEDKKTLVMFTTAQSDKNNVGFGRERCHLYASNPIPFTLLLKL